MGDGQGQGERPEAVTEKGYFDSQVRGKLRPGEAIRTGDADGPNIAGLTQEEVKQEIESTSSQDSDPLTNQRLPRSQREHAKQYFERFRKGE